MKYFQHENDSYNETSHDSHYTKPIEPAEITDWGHTTDFKNGTGTFPNLIQA